MWGYSPNFNLRMKSGGQVGEFQLDDQENKDNHQKLHDKVKALQDREGISYSPFEAIELFDCLQERSDLKYNTEIEGTADY